MKYIKKISLFFFKWACIYIVGFYRAFVITLFWNLLTLKTGFPTINLYEAYIVFILYSLLTTRYNLTWSAITIDEPDKVWVSSAVFSVSVSTMSMVLYWLILILR